MWSGAASDAPDSWVDEDVEHVNDDVDDDEGQCHRDGDALDDVHVVTGDALEDELSHPLILKIISMTTAPPMA